VTADTYEVLIARYGHRDTVRSEVFLNYHLHGQPDGPIGMDYFVWIVRNAERTVLVDTGFSRRGGDRRSRQTLIGVPELYRQLGVRPDDRPTVVVTHAHYDHIGNLELFPSSQVIMSRREYDFWTGPYARRTLFHHSVEDDELAALQEAVAAGRVCFFSDTITVAPGIEVVEVGGHTPGQSVVKAATSDGTVLLAADAVHYYEELEEDFPFSTVADLVGMYAAFDRIRGWVAAGDVAHVVAGHDPGTLHRFTPIDGPLSELVSAIGGPIGTAVV
jgi:glyoxylase-like metal-dependent hydrolase (beta-lactamase superfamily II)